MSKKRKSIHVSHPLYGDTPNYTNDRFQLGDILNSHWSYKEESVVLGTVIEANIDKQNYSIYQRKLYVDLKKKCVQCNRWFLFYAEEQRYWFETLGFYIDADCTKCIDCRKKEQSIKAMQHEYEALKKNDERTVEETRKLKNIALELYQLGYIKNKVKLMKSANKAFKRDSQRLAGLVQSLAYVFMAQSLSSGHSVVAP